MFYSCVHYIIFIYIAPLHIAVFSSDIVDILWRFHNKEFTFVHQRTLYISYIEKSHTRHVSVAFGTEFDKLGSGRKREIFFSFLCVTIVFYSRMISMQSKDSH